jgi:hypothetical protein
MARIHADLKGSKGCMGTKMGFLRCCLNGSQITPYYTGASSRCLLMHAALRFSPFRDPW